MKPIQQLRIFVDHLLKISFLLPDPNNYWVFEVTPSEIREIKYHNPRIKRYLNPGYYSHKDLDRIHYYSRVEDCSVYIAESRGGDNAGNWWSSDIEEFDEIYSLLIDEYKGFLSDLVKILGTPTYLEDEFRGAIIKNKEKNDWKRRDIPLERQMVNWLGTFKLAYWIIDERVIYLNLNWVDREEPIAIVLGCRPIRLGNEL